MKSESFERLKSVPPLVRIIISQATRRRVSGNFTEADFNAQMRRLEAEELVPKGLKLLTRVRQAGGLRFIVKEVRTGKVCDLLDFTADGSPESEVDGSGFGHSDGAE